LKNSVRPNTRKFAAAKQDKRLLPLGIALPHNVFRRIRRRHVLPSTRHFLQSCLEAAGVGGAVFQMGISMKSCHVAAAILASLFLGLTASQAAACSCKERSEKEKFSSADLVVKGRMKLVTYGVPLPVSQGDEPPPRMTRGDFEVDKVLKGKLKDKTLPIYTGTGMGDCGRLDAFLGAAVYYESDKFAVWEFGLSKIEHGGQTVYFTSICEYIKAPNQKEE
jgi:hypothetical protein